MIATKRTGGQFATQYGNGITGKPFHWTKPLKLTLPTDGNAFEEHRTFLVSELNEYDVILGRRWLRDHNPATDWIRDTFKFSNGTMMEANRLPPPPSEGVALLNIVHPKELQDEEDVHYAQIKSATNPYVTGDIAISPAKDQQLRAEFTDVFVKELPTLPQDREIQVQLDTQGAAPIYKRPYRLTLEEQKELEKQLHELLRIGVIRPSMSEWGASVLFVRKKDGSLRLCVDYRAINSVTRTMRYPLPRIEDIFDSLGGATVFSRLDLKSGYHQLRMAPNHIHKTAFITKFGHFEYVTAPFGLKNLPSYFQKLMNTILGKVLYKSVLIYLDDIIIFSKSIQEHDQHIREVLTILRDNKLYRNAAKSSLYLESITCLGFVVTGGNIEMDPEKTNAIRKIQRPTTIQEVRAFLGMVTYLRRFCGLLSQARIRHPAFPSN